MNNNYMTVISLCTSLSSVVVPFLQNHS